MKALAKLAIVAVVGWGLNNSALAADMDSAVAYSLGEFDRVGLSQPAPRTGSGKAQKKSPTSVARSAQDRQMNAQKAEFVRRMFWMALSMR
jgi:hypothetical protein